MNETLESHPSSSSAYSTKSSSRSRCGSCVQVVWTQSSIQEHRSITQQQSMKWSRRKGTCSRSMANTSDVPAAVSARTGGRRSDCRSCPGVPSVPALCSIASVSDWLRLVHEHARVMAGENVPTPLPCGTAQPITQAAQRGIHRHYAAAFNALSPGTPRRACSPEFSKNLYTPL